MEPMMQTIPYRIHCSEIWGGMRNTDSDVCTRGITASIYSSACDAEQGGDIYYLALCSNDVLTRTVIADVRGHGSAVTQIGQWVYKALEESMDTLDGTIILKQLNQLIHAHGFRALTTAVVAGFYVHDSSLSICYGGHPPALFRQEARASNWKRLDPPPSSVSTNLLLGALPDTLYDQMVFQLHPGDRIALYTDGITECENPEGTQLGVEGLCSFLQQREDQELATLKQGVIRELSKYAGGKSYEDDITLLLMEIR
jgi:sigma-B regulation protein RsbU (phosphoserine phosphatase)